MKAEIQFLYIFRVKWEIGPENIKYRKGKAECKFIKINFKIENERSKRYKFDGLKTIRSGSEPSIFLILDSTLGKLYVL